MTTDGARSSATLERPPNGARARFATPRDPSRLTDGHRVGVVAKHLGTPFMPWQQQIADVAGERLPNGAYAYPVVVVTVPRQSGKTTLMRAVAVERCISSPDLPAFYTAQTGKDARDRWNDLVKQVNRSPLKTKVQVRRAAGQERLVFPNGSEFRCFAPTPSSLHGYTPPLVMLDEAFAHDDATGNDLMGAIGPAQITLVNRQLWIVSTAGTAASGFLNRWVEAGRAGADGVALFEWSAGPDITDPYDPAGWWTFHPALGITIPEEAIAAEAGRLSRSEFERAYLNRTTVTESHVIPPEQWDALAAGTGDNPPQEPPGEGVPLLLAYDADHDRQSATITAHWTGPGGRRMARVVDHGPGMGWVADKVTDYRARWNVRGVAADDGGPAREITDVLRRGHVPVTSLNAREFANAWGFLMQHLAHPGPLVHDGSLVLSAHASAVVTRPMGDGSAPSRRNSPGPISALVAVMVGDYAQSRRPVDAGPLFRFND